jgi:hypothetical protein
MLDFLDQCLQGDLIGFCHILQGAKLLHETANALGFVSEEYRKSARGSLQYLLDSQMGVESFCVHFHK